MKNPQDLCHAEYRVYRRQMQQIRVLAQQSHQRPSEILRTLLDQALQHPGVYGNQEEGVTRHG